MEEARISEDELTCVGYPVSEEATEKFCQDMEKIRKKARMFCHSSFFPNFFHILAKFFCSFF